MMTMMMMQRLVETSSHEKGKSASEDSRDTETKSDEEDLNVDVENDDALCPVDLTRRQCFDASAGDFKAFKVVKEEGLKDGRSESVCSDDVSRSDSPGGRVQSPSVVTQQNRRLAFSVENILDPNKFTGRQVYNDGICCWKPHQESLGSPDFDGSETGTNKLPVI